MILNVMKGRKEERTKTGNEVISCPVEGFLELHSIAMEGKKGEKRAKNDNFLANGESLNHFNMKKCIFCHLVGLFLTVSESSFVLFPRQEHFI